MKVPNISFVIGDNNWSNFSLSVLDIAKYKKMICNLNIIEIGNDVYNKGVASGIGADAWKSIEINEIIFSVPIDKNNSSNENFLVNNIITHRLELCCKKIIPSVVDDQELFTLIHYNNYAHNQILEYKINQNHYHIVESICYDNYLFLVQEAFEHAQNFSNKELLVVNEQYAKNIHDNLLNKAILELKEKHDINIQYIDCINFIDSYKNNSLEKDKKYTILSSEKYSNLLQSLLFENCELNPVVLSNRNKQLYTILNNDNNYNYNPVGLLHSFALMMLNDYPKQAQSIISALENSLDNNINNTTTHDFIDYIINYKFNENKFKDYISLNNQQNYQNCSDKKLLGIDIIVSNINYDLNDLVKIIQQKTKWKNLELKVISQNKQEVWPTQSIISTKHKDLVLRFLAKKDVRIKDCNKIIKIITSLDIDIMFSYYLYIHSDDMLGFFIPEQY